MSERGGAEPPREPNGGGQALHLSLAPLLRFEIQGVALAA